MLGNITIARIFEHCGLMNRLGLNCIMIYLRLLGAMIITDFLLQEAIHSLRKQSHFSKSKDKASCSEKFLKYKPIFP